MKKYLRWAAAVAGLGVALFFYMLAVNKAALLRKCEDSAIIILGSPLTARQVSDMEKQEAAQDSPCDFAAWYQENNVSAVNERLGRQHSVSVVTVRGRTDLLLRGSAWLDEEQAGSCLVDENTAMALFGSDRIEGLSLEVDGKEWIIRGILYDVDDTVICEGRSDSEKSFSLLTVDMKGNDSYESVQQDFMTRNGLSGQFVPMNMLAALSRFCCLLIPLIAGLRILAHCAGGAYVCRNNTFGIIAGVGVVICGSLFLLWLLSRIQLPADLSPTKWSDLAYWADWWQRQKEALLLLLVTEKQRPLQPCLIEFYQALGCCLAGTAAALKTPFPD